jgi:hypothetical protein
MITMDNHHIAGEANGPITVPVPVNEHRAELSPGQYDWPRETLENPEGCPLLKGAAHIRGFRDWVVNLIDRVLLWVAEALEWLHTYLIEELGPKWWVGTPLEKLAPRS